MNIQGSYTNKGLALAAKTAAGARLRVTRVVAGSGTTTDIPNATALPSIQQTLAVGEAHCVGSTAILPVTLTAAELDTSYALTELGLYADDPDEGEILYSVCRLDQPVTIRAGSEMVLRFYLRQTISEDGGAEVLCSPAGLITESDCAPVRRKVMSTESPSRTVTLTMEELADYIRSLPRLLTENLTITVSGEWTGEIPILGFYGSGRLNIQGENTAVVNGNIRIVDCSCMVRLKNLSINATESMAEKGGYLLYCSAAGVVYLAECSLVGQGKSVGLRIAESSQVTVALCSVTGCASVVEDTTSSIVTFAYSSGAGYANNTLGINAYSGGIAILCGGVPDMLGGTSNRKAGGVIFSQSGSLL